MEFWVRFLELGVNVIEALLWYKIASYYLSEKYEHKYYIIAFFSLSLIMCSRVVYLWFGNDKIVNDTLTVVREATIIILTFKLYSDSIKAKVVNLLLYTIGLALADIVVMVFFSMVSKAVIDDFKVPSTAILSTSIISKYILLVLIRKFRGIKSEIRGIVRKLREMIVTIIMVEFLLIIVTLIYYENADTLSPDVTFILIMIDIIIVSGIFIYTIIRLFKLSNEITESRLKTQYMEMQLKQNEDMSVLSSNLRSLRHDMNNHIGVIYGLLDTQQYNRLKDYLDELYSELMKANDVVIANNEIISIILNNKKHIAREKNIQLTICVDIHNFILNEIETCSLLGNLLDNALEATDKLCLGNEQYDREILFSCLEKETGWFINCTNQCSEIPVIKQGVLVTTKENKKVHGIGSRTMKGIVNKYRGSIEYCLDKSYFTVKIFIPKDTVEG